MGGSSNIALTRDQVEALTSIAAAFRAVTGVDIEMDPLDVYGVIDEMDAQKLRTVADVIDPPAAQEEPTGAVS